MNDEILEFINNWSQEPKINGKSFDQLFQIDNVPLWWFLKKHIYTGILPSKINLYSKLEKKEKIDFFNDLKYQLNVKAMKLYLANIEKKKIRIAKKKIIFEKKDQILLLSYINHISNDNKIFRLDKIINKLQKDNKYTPLVIFADALSRTSYNQISQLTTVYSYCDQKIIDFAKNKAREISKKWKNLDLQTKKQLLYYGNKDYFPYFKYALDFYFSEEFLTLLLINYESFKRIITTEDIKIIVVTGFSSIAEKCAMAAAKYYNKPTVYITHGLAKKQIGPDLIYDTKLAVVSEYSKKIFVDLGVKTECIRVVGPVIFDETVEFRSKKKSQLKNILIAPGAAVSGDKLTKDQYFNNFERLISDIKSFGDIEINIKPHPRSVSSKDFMRIVEKYEKVNFHKPNVSREHFYKLIQDCDIFIHFGSNSALEAMIIGRPIITLDPLYDGKPNYHWLQGSKSAIEINFNQDIKGAIILAIKEQEFLKKEAGKVVEEKLGEVDGRAYERIVNLIYESCTDIKN